MQLQQCSIEGLDMCKVISFCLCQRIKYEKHALPGAFFSVESPGMIDKDATDGLSGRSEEMQAILPGNRPLMHKFEIGLVCQGRGL